jgi:uncharacterized membrane protein YcaP (DUF421 family)
MHILIDIFGQGRDLTIAQMCSRGTAVFFIALLLIRVSGRRSFGVHSPLDNIITIVLGAVLSRAIVGVSAFVPVIVCCTVIVLLHRFVAWLISHSRIVEKVVEGEKILLFENGRFIEENMRKALVCKEDVLQSVRKSALSEDLSKIERIYMEKNGEVSAIRI